jgi:ribosomal protein S18 acetylase RimI-like enzyme
VTELQITYSTIHSDDELLTSDIDVLVELIHNAISTNNSVGFLHTTTKSELIEFWQNEINELETANTFLIARDGIRIVGIVILTRETRPNGRHRAELRKLIVHSEYQRNGIAHTLETQALIHGLNRHYYSIAINYRKAELEELGPTKQALREVKEKHKRMKEEYDRAFMEAKRVPGLEVRVVVVVVVVGGW